MKEIFIILLSILCIVQAQLKDNGFINITITGFNDKAINGQAVSKKIDLAPKSVSTIKIENIPVNVTYLIIQVHTHEDDIIIEYNETVGNQTEVEGSNIGLVLNPQEPRTIIKNKNNKNISVLVAVVYYLSQGPIPGACSINSNLNISPYLKLLLSDGKIEVDAQAASFEKLKCDNVNQISYDAYRLFITESDYSSDKYFSTILKMITVDDIIKNGIKIPAAVTTSQMRRVYSAYPGTGSAYAMIANYGNYSSAYVTTFSYACDPFTDPESCNLFSDTFTKFVCIVILIIGSCLTFIGHAGPSFEMFLWGSINGAFIGCILSAPIGWSMLIGLASGIVSLIFIGMEISFIPTFQAALTTSSLAFGIIYFFISDGTEIFEIDRQFFLIYLVLTMIVLVLFCSFPSYSNVFFSSFVGSYMILLPFDFWLGSNLKYIVINIVRRLTVYEFNIARIDHPFQTYDIILMILWAGLMLWGIKKQNENVEFVTTVTSTGSFPVLSGSRNNRRVLVIRDSDDVTRSAGFFA